MGATLAEGIGRVGQWQGVLVGLADMPYIRASSYTAVAGDLTREGICVPRYEGKRGHPVGFGRRYFPDLAGLSGDQGARELLRQYADSINYLDLDDPGILRDIDRKEDLV
jgi:molybdenum cofactor cytidylyltransferase